MKQILIISHLLIITISVFNLFKKDHRSYTLNKFLWVYVLIFWGIAPYIQYLLNDYPWGLYISNDQAFKSNAFILLWIISFLISKKLFRTLKIKTLNHNTIQSFQIKGIGFIVLLGMQLAIFLYFLSQYGSIMFLRGESAGMNLIGSNQSIHLIVSQVTRGITTFIAILLLYNYKMSKNFSNGLFLAISLLLLLLTNFPLALARYMAGAFYIALVFVAKPYLKTKNLVTISLLALFLIIYPASSAIRNLTSLDGFEFITTSLETFSSGDFDNYSTLNMTLQHVEKNGITFGNQLFGVMLFFIPRSVWPSKPVGSGAYVADNRFMDFTNISCPYLAEGYINFGIIGIIISAILLSYIVAKFDSKYYTYSKINFVKLFYPVMLGLIFFILRGDLMSSFAYTISFAIAALLVLGISKLFIRHINEKITSN